MIFGIITHAVHKIKDGRIYAYEPYVREMNLWAKYVDEIIILAPISNDEINNIEIAYQHDNIKIVEIPNFDITSIKNLLKSLFVIPKVCKQIYKVMKQSNHIHLRCPGNVGLLGCFVQIFFPTKPKTTKYAGNWDPKSKQPFSYRLQKSILSNTLLTKNIKVLVYGDWKQKSKNIIPFFTASYSENEISEIKIKNFNNKIKLIFVGNFSKGKQPLKSVKVLEILLKKGYDAELNMFGNGDEFNTVNQYLVDNKLQQNVFLKGNQPKETIKKAFQESHFLVFISKSEGWPKVIAEAMFWSCLPISTKVSCVPYMLDFGKRGAVVSNDVNEISNKIEMYIQNSVLYSNSILEAKKWSHKFTLEAFEREIRNFL